MSRYDVVIIGGGAAGLSAGLVLSRARRKVLVVDSGAPRNAPAAHMQGFLSRDGLPPTDLLAFGRDEVTGYGGEIVLDAVTELQASDVDGFDVALSDGRTVTARRLLVTTGLRDELPDIAGLRDRWARDVLHCPYCHGWEVRGQRLGVIGDGSPESVQYAHIVRQWSDDVVVVVPPRTLTGEQRTQLGARAIGVVEGQPSRVLVEHDRLIGVELDDDRVVLRDALFVPPRFVPNNDLLINLGCAHEEGWVTKDATGRTSVPGVWVAGNVANPRAQVITAAGEGSAAAIALNADLVSEDIRLAVESATRLV
ncbi:MAG: NAD(P)/FAD-dependent oxidoreductase [Mycobacteriaceae bacterium]|jgi:thioredoxin reductase